MSALLALGLITGCTTQDTAAIRHAPRISDTSFEHGAVVACRRAVQVFNTTATLGREPSRTQSADLLDLIDATFAQLVGDLRQVPVAPRDHAAVAGWLADWDTYVAFGRTYAVAVRNGTERDLISENQASQGALRRRLQAFASANNMKACKFE